MLSTRAPAKINLSLHVVRRRDDGYHELESLVAFTGSGDALSLTPGSGLSLKIQGPTAGAAGDGADNLVLCAARRLAERVDGLRLGEFALAKRLPVAAGIGGGSSDAAAALRLLAQANSLSLNDPRLIEAAKATGADVPVCLTPTARMMRGVGDVLGPSLALRPLPALLVNPGVAVETKSIFARFGLAPGEEAAMSAHPRIDDDAPLLPTLSRCRNDLEDAAGSFAPVIVDALAVLRGARGSRLARMSGSGATCFALFETCAAATKAARVIRRQHPAWWVRTALLR